MHLASIPAGALFWGPSVEYHITKAFSRSVGSVCAGSFMGGEISCSCPPGGQFVVEILHGMPRTISDADHDDGKRILGCLYHRFDGRPYVTRIATVYEGNSINPLWKRETTAFSREATLMI